LPTGELVSPVADNQMGQMMLVFSIGYVAVFLVFTLLYWRAYAKRTELELNPIEVFDTRTEFQENVIHICVGLLSIGLASRGTRGYAALAGYCYVIIGPLMTVHGLRAGKKRKKLEASLTAGEEAETARTAEIELTHTESG
jgi:hypothetical protein